MTMTKKAMIAAGCLALVVMGVFWGLVVFAKSNPEAFGEKTSQEEAGDGKFVPPLERIAKERVDPASGVTHSKMKQPDTKIFQTLYKGGTQVTFHHKVHVERYGLGCIECHHVERCDRCHAMNKASDVRITTGKQALHETCITCHAEGGGPAKCAECHKQ